MKKVNIIGSGFSSLSAACHLAKRGFRVEVFEKNSSLGGRARQFKQDGFTFDMGPSWYWMPDVFERFFEGFAKKCLIITNSSASILDIKLCLEKTMFFLFMTASKK